MLLTAVWAFAASLATGVGLVAVHLVAGQVGDQVSSPLSEHGVRQALSGVAPALASTPSSSPRPRTTSPAVRQGALRTVRTHGGVVGARCEEGLPQLVYASPAQGWRTDRSRDTLVRFVSSSQAVSVRLACTGDVLGTSTHTDDLSPRPSPSPSEQPSPRESPESTDPSASDHPDAVGDSGSGS